MSFYPGMQKVDTFTNKLETDQWMDLDNGTLFCSILRKTINLRRMRKKNYGYTDVWQISDAFGPSGFEEDVIRTIAGYCKEFELSNDAMNNLYARMPGASAELPVVQLDAHTDECGFMVQNIQDNGCLGILMLGGFHLTSLPAHSVWVRTRTGKMVRGIICCKTGSFYDGAGARQSEP